MDCGHTFCNSCWQQHMRVQILDGHSRRLLCMAFKCGTVCDEDKVWRGLSPVLDLMAMIITRCRTPPATVRHPARACEDFSLEIILQLHNESRCSLDC